MKPSTDLTTTQRLPAYETMADLVASDPARLAWLRTRPCRAPGTTPHPSGDPHHLRHTESGASIGAGLKDDSRTYSLCRAHHGDVERGLGPWEGWTRDEIKRWENEQVEHQGAEYEASHQGDLELMEF